MNIKDLLNKYPKFDSEGNRYGGESKEEVRKTRKHRVSRVAASEKKKGTQSSE